jgi:hypothetical protein
VRYLNISAVAKRLRAAVQSQRLRLAVESSRLRLKDIVVGIFIVIKDLFDSLVITETVSKDVGKDESESIVLSDTSVFDLDKLVDEPITTLDDVAFFISKLTDDQLDVLEQVSLSVGIPVSDSGTVTDDSVWELIKAITDNPSLIDEARFDVAKSISDTVFVTDDLGGEATIDDDQTIQFLKVRSDIAFVTEVLSKIVAYNRDFSDVATVSDSPALSFSTSFADAFQAAEFAVKLLGKGESDTLAGVDSGTLLNQDYVDNPYYFADDYVGDKRIF